MKSCTDLNQSKKLAEILPLESADMHYERVYFEGKQSDWFVKLGRPIKSDDIVPCWSLAALIDILPEDIIGQRHYFFEISKMGDASTPHKVRYYRFREGSDGGDFGKITWISRQANNLVDACVEMILKLHKLKML